MTATTTAITATIEAADPARARHAPTLSVVRDEPARAAWRCYLEDAPDATLFHHPIWCDAVQATFGHIPQHLIARRGSDVVGVLPLMELRSWLAGRLLVSVPYGTYGGLLATDDEARDALAREAVQRVRDCGARLLELRSADAAVPEFAHDDRYVRFARELPDRSEACAALLPRKARAAARQARERERLQVRHDAELLPLVWRLYARSMRRLGSLAYPQRFFRALADRLGERAWVTTVWRDAQPVAGVVSFVFGETVMPYFAGTDERVRCTGSTNLVYLAVMERAVDCGLRRFDFGRSRRDNAGPYAFKCNQGFEPQALGYQRYVPSGSRAPDLTPSNPRFALARRLWRHLPVSVSARLGGWLARSIPG